METIHTKPDTPERPCLTRLDGISLPVTIIPDSENILHELPISETRGEQYLVRDYDGRIIPFPKPVNPWDRHPEKFLVKGDKLLIRESEYRRYRHYEPGETEEGLFYRYLHLIWMQRQKVLDEGRYFLIRVDPVLQTGGSWIGTYRYCLGGLLESWQQRGDLVVDDPEDGSKIYIFRASGHTLSGAHEWTGWNEAKNEFVRGWNLPRERPENCRYIPITKKFRELHTEFRRIGDQYSDFEQADVASLKEMVLGLQSDEELISLMNQ